MALVGAGMYRNAICTKALAINSSFQNAGIITTTAVTQGSYFIDVY
jgi:hypothetical protein